MLFLYVVMMLVATLLTMRTSLGQSRVCYMCGGARGYVFTRVLDLVAYISPMQEIHQ